MLEPCRRSLRILAFTLVFLAAIPGASAVEPPAAFEFSPPDVERIWIGPELWANRLQDWRLKDRRLVCTESRRRFPLRTVHLLTRSARPDGEGYSLFVRTDAVDDTAAAGSDEAGFRGFLIGAGGSHVDHRLTALTHHRPAEDGGLLAVVDDSGRVSLRDNSAPSSLKGTWSIAGAIEPEDLPVLAAAERVDGAPRGPIELWLRAERTGPERYSVTVSAMEQGSARELSRATLRDVDGRRVDGGFALVSHLGPKPNPAGNGYWFQDFRIEGDVESHEERRFGPILTAQHTVSDGRLKLTAQAGPLGARDTPTATLELQSEDGEWRESATETLTPDSYTFPFRLDGFTADRDVPYRVRYDLITGFPDRSEPTYYEGVIRHEPTEEVRAGREFVIAAFTGHKCYTGGLKWNHDGVWFPHAELVDAVRAHHPDFLFFSGDQIYEGDLNPAESRPESIAILDYLYKWYRWCWAFDPLLRDTPAVTIPDDHDVYHGNIWGAGGVRAADRDDLTSQDRGGYKLGARFVNAVHRTQTSHLPDPVDPTPIANDISVYYTRVEYAGVSFAVIADRQWKSSPSVAVPDGQAVNGWFQSQEFDPATEADVEGAVLLGDRQLGFLRDWAGDWSHDAFMKVVLSQTIFANVATIPGEAKSGAVLPSLPYLSEGEYPSDYKLAADGDSNGWPQSGRDRAIREMRRGFAVHIAGDQHLGSLIQYGVDAFGDAGFALCVPSVANTWPRRWFPPEPGQNRIPGAPPYTGEFRDGFGNRMTVHAASNPYRVDATRGPVELNSRAPGYGIVRLRRPSRTITFENWPRWIDPTQSDVRPYPGWPLTVEQRENYGRVPLGWLPTARISGLDEPVLRVIDERTGVVEYALRLSGPVFQPPAFGPGPFTLEVGDPDGNRWQRVEGLILGPRHRRSLRFDF